MTLAFRRMIFINNLQSWLYNRKLLYRAFYNYFLLFMYKYEDEVKSTEVLNVISLCDLEYKEKKIPLTWFLAASSVIILCLLATSCLLLKGRREVRYLLMIFLKNTINFTPKKLIF